MKHLHHIVPKHMGGTDNPSNIIELTVEEHARAHYLLWNQYGKEEDKFAWKGLSGIMSKSEITSEILKLAGLRTYKNHWKPRLSEFSKQKWQNESYRNKMIPHIKKIQSIAVQAALTEESKQKRKETFQRIGHSKGSKNPMYGKMWITNGIESYRINKTDSIPEGFRKGRICKQQAPLA